MTANMCTMDRLRTDGPSKNSWNY